MSSTTTQQGPQESRIFNPPAAFIAQANVAGMDGYNALCAEAEADYEGFWARLANEHLAWHKPFTKTLINNPPEPSAIQARLAQMFKNGHELSRVLWLAADGGR